MKMEIAREVLTVSDLNRSAKDLLEQAFPLLWVSGEISKYRRHASGHWYFSLKDEKFLKTLCYVPGQESVPGLAAQRWHASRGARAGHPAIRAMMSRCT